MEQPFMSPSLTLARGHLMGSLMTVEYAQHSMLTEHCPQEPKIPSSTMDFPGERIEVPSTFLSSVLHSQICPPTRSSESMKNISEQPWADDGKWFRKGTWRNGKTRRLSRNNHRRHSMSYLLDARHCSVCFAYGHLFNTLATMLHYYPHFPKTGIQRGWIKPSLHS